MPTSGDLQQPTQEVVQTPRQSVETSLNKRGIIANEINEIENRYRFPRSPEVSARRTQLGVSLQEAIADFRQNIVNKLPEAEVWVEIEKENDRAVRENQSYRAEHASTPGEKSCARAAIQGVKNSLSDAERNLAEVRKLNVGVPTNSSKTP